MNTRFAMTPVIAALCIMVCSSPSVAQYVTPSGDLAILFQPCAFELGDTADGALAGFIWNRYGFESIKDEHEDNFPVCTVPDFDTALRGQFPWLYVNTHGGIVFEAYAPTTQGLAARDASYNSYVPSLYGGTIVVRQTMFEDDGTTPRMYVILCVEGFVRTRYQGSKLNNISRSVVHFAGCDAWNFRSAFRTPNSNLPAAAFMSYDYTVTNGVVEADGNTIYYRLSGGEGVLKRPLHQAVQGLTLRIDPTNPSPPTAPDIVISPRVKATSLAQGAHFASAQSYWVDFDAPMKTTQSMSSVIGCEGNIKFDDGTLAWVNSGTRLQGTLRGLAKGPGTVVLDSYDPDNFDLDGMMSDTGIGLDGNTDPSNNTVGGELPAGDKWRGAYISDYADNPDGIISGFTAVSDTVSWRTEAEYDADRYFVDYASSPTDSFVTVAETPAVGSGLYRLILPELQDGFVRLRQRTTSGDIKTYAYTARDNMYVAVPQFVVDEAAAASLQQDLESHYSGLHQTQSVTTVYTDLIIAPAIFQSQANTYATFKTGRGIPTTVRIVENIGGVAGIKPTIASLVAQGVRSVLLMGKANDDRDAQGNLRYNNPACWDSGYVHPGHPSQAGQNLIPMWEHKIIPGPQATSMPYRTKYISSDWGYIDLNGDGLPDPGLAIGRLPVMSAGEATNAMNKQMFAFQINPNSYGANRVFIFTYAFDVYGNSGADVISHTDRLMQWFPANLIKERFVDKPSAFYTDAQRDALFKTKFNNGLWVIKGTANGPTHDAGGLDQSRGAYLGDIPPSPNVMPFVYVGACSGGNDDETYVIRPLNKQLLVNRSDLGIIGYFAPSRGTWQTGDALMDSTYLKELYQLGAPSNGHAAARSVYKLAVAHPQYRDMALSYVFMGDPSVPLPFMQISTVGVEDQTASQVLQLAPPFPNPAYNRGMMFRFSLPRSERTTFSIVDVSGRLVASIINGDVDAGMHVVRWDGTDRFGVDVAGGVYFAHLRVGSQSKVQKVVVLR